jgi:hypothetical protein
MAKLAPKRYGDRPEIEQAPQALVIQWQSTPSEPPVAPPPPEQIAYQKPQLPADLSQQAWSILVDLLELIQRSTPSNSDRPPEEVFEVVRKALLAHFAEAADA